MLVLLIGDLATWPYSRRYGYGPSGLFGLLLVVLLLLIIFQVAPFGFYGPKPVVPAP